MYQLVESIWIKDRVAFNLNYHQARMDETIRVLYGKENKFNLSKLIDTDDIEGEQKLRFLYNSEEFKIEVKPYERKTIKKVQVVFDNKIKYTFKFLERKELDYLYSMREDADEIIIFRENILTDAYYYNVVLEKNGRYYTPQRPLLNGVMRSKLIDEGILIQKNISINKIFDFEKLHLINALNPLGLVSINVKEVMA
jgi:4-amino-4-deoxychorismate lyase